MHFYGSKCLSNSKQIDDLIWCKIRTTVITAIHDLNFWAVVILEGSWQVKCTQFISDLMDLNQNKISNYSIWITKSGQQILRALDGNNFMTMVGYLMRAMSLCFIDSDPKGNSKTWFNAEFGSQIYEKKLYTSVAFPQSEHDILNAYHRMDLTIFEKQLRAKRDAQYD